ncbi:hypothetical protein HanRHA438_Chr03g0142101 [Helianthus annuus]|nr:hypothetical protein HanIR_Chr03g0142121 [Helianthus annuus]KAJ0937432.1 hypothetical protein HanRHA438_Chr03g0142101 [Helianthus annuus]
MAAQNLTYEELLDQIQLSLQRMIDIIKTPPPTSAHEPPSPASTITTPPVTALVPPPVSAATPQPASLLLPQPIPQQTPPQALKTVPKPVPPEPKTAPNQSPSTMPSLVQKPTPTVFRTQLKKTMNLVPTGMEMTRVTCVLERREWRPPWRAVVSAPNAVGRLEWRPPWSVSRIMSRFLTLWTRFLQGERNDVCHVLQTMHTITTILALTYPRCFCLQHFLLV